MSEYASHKHPSITSAKTYLDYKVAKGVTPSFEPPEVVIFLYQKSFVERVIRDYNCTPCDGYFHQLHFLDDHPGAAFLTIRDSLADLTWNAHFDDEGTMQGQCTLFQLFLDSVVFVRENEVSHGPI